MKKTDEQQSANVFWTKLYSFVVFALSNTRKISQLQFLLWYTKDELLKFTRFFSRIAPAYAGIANNITDLGNNITGTFSPFL